VCIWPAFSFKSTCSLISNLPYIFMKWWLINQRDKFTFCTVRCIRTSLFDHKSGWISLLWGNETGTGTWINCGDDTRNILFCLMCEVDQNSL
jgi:hypothetical protein